jgi:Domain of unknown function (DUF4411)
MGAALRRIYCVDSSSFIYCQKAFADRPSRVTFYASVWGLLNHLAADGRLLAPHQVFAEITKNRDEVGRWAVAHSGVFRPKGEYAARVVEILKEPGQRLVEAAAPRGAEESDPWVIALAEGVSATPTTLWDDQQVGVVVSEEAKVGGVRDICARRKVDHLDFTEMLNAEGLSFGPAAAT